MSVKIAVQPFGEYEGKQVKKYTITGDKGMEISAINYGATITNIIVPDRNGLLGDIVLGFDTVSGYVNAGNYYIGGICGRYANRIANGRFRINGSEYKLPGNNGINCLHGGFKGFDKVYWDAEINSEGDGVTFMYNSIDGEEGFPGNMKVTVNYRLFGNALHIEYAATTDKASPVNLTSHCYFNLSGDVESDILSHELQINANHFLESNSEMIPTGEFLEVKNTSMDFTTLRRADAAIDKTKDYDHCWVLNKVNGDLEEVASLTDQKSGRRMKVLTTEPGIHFYSGHFLDGNFTDTKEGKLYGKYSGLCLEAQHYPDSPNKKHFPNTILQPGETYRQQTIYKFENI
ncbi:hypothetical protein CAP36_11550 [Chitinophagaceae bacterium IBVUCB2]|nr:hypothetical protein CAP36_11550 [Chitinophagaceae bacterium IBVUCB2]